MNGERAGFKRMVVGLPQGLANQASVETAADLAEVLRIELLAMFIADSTLHMLAGLSGSRELRTLDQEWQPIDVAQITRDIDHVVGLARRRFVESVKSRVIKTSFDVVAGTEVFAALIRADDIVALLEPAHPGERITHQFTGLVDTAFSAAGAVLVVPRRIMRTVGPIAMLASGPDDPGIRTAMEIAAAINERLVVITAAQTGLPKGLLADAERLGIQIEQAVANRPPANAAIAGLQERLRIRTRRVGTDDIRQLFSSLHGIPLLLIEPDRLRTVVEQETGQDRLLTDGL